MLIVVRCVGHPAWVEMPLCNLFADGMYRVTSEPSEITWYECPMLETDMMVLISLE